MDITPEQARLEQEAIHWFALLKGGRELSSVSLQEWDRWRADAANKAEYAELVRLCAKLRTLPRPPLPSLAELEQDDSEPPEA